MKKRVEILDTIRDASQDPELNISLEDRIELAKVSDRLGVDFIELNWPRTSEYELNKDIEMYQRLKKELKHSRLVAFTSTARPHHTIESDSGLNAVLATGASYATLVAKTWHPHIMGQLKISPKANLRLIEGSCRYLKERGVETFVDFEHFFIGFMDNPQYAMDTIRAGKKGGATRLVLCDTLGNIDEREINAVLPFLEKEFSGDKEITLGIHEHNDRGLAISNIATFVNGVLRFSDKVHLQGTMNGLGERLGNASLTTFLPELQFFRGIDLPNINLKELTRLSGDVATITGTDQTQRLSYVHKAAFMHKGGIHADAILKIGPEAYNPLDPTLIGNRTWIIYTDQGGASAMAAFAQQLGYKLNKTNEDHKRKIDYLRAKARQFLERGYDINYSEDVARLFMLRYLKGKKSIVSIDERSVFTNYKTRTDGGDLKKPEDNSIANIVHGYIKDKGMTLHEIENELAESNHGPVSATFEVLKAIYTKHYPGVRNIKMEYFGLKVLKNRNGGKDEYSGATVQTPIIFSNGKERWTMIGVSPDTQTAATEAIRKGFDYAIFMKYINGKR